MTPCLLALGSNLGDRYALLRQATAEIARLPGCQLVARSRWFETAPIGGPDKQGAFLNGAVVVETILEPQPLVAALRTIESRLGRTRELRWDARLIDIDLLLYGDRKIATAELTVPHVRMACRRFVLEPAAEIAGEMVHPTSGWTIAGLLRHLAASTPYVAVTAADATVAEWLTRELARDSGCRRLEEWLPSERTTGDLAELDSIELRQAIWEALEQFRLQTELNTLTAPEGNIGLIGNAIVLSAFWYWATLKRRSDHDTMARSCGEENARESSKFPVEKKDVRPALILSVEPKIKKDFQKTFSGKISSIEARMPTLSDSDFRRLLDRKGHGPMLRIESDEPSEVLQEARAALSAAWPNLA